MKGHTPGPGLKVLDRKTRWYGGGYCGICGSRGDELIPQAVRWWDADDGWKMGVLCSYCGEEAAERGPRRGDYAWKDQDGAERIDTLASLGDLDSTYSDGLD